MARYTKLPVTIEAVQFLGFTIPPGENNWKPAWGEEPPDWLSAACDIETRQPGAIWFEDGHPSRDDPLGQWPVLFVGMTEGPIRASPRDWIIRGIAHELYPCKPDIFKAIYEPEVPTDDEAAPADLMKPPGTFRDDLASCLNRWSVENWSGNTPDFLLADFCIEALRALGHAIDKREEWYGRKTGAPPLDPRETLEQTYYESVVKSQDAEEPQFAVADLMAILHEAHDTFRGYEDHHRARYAEHDSYDLARFSLEKAERNRVMAEKIEHAIEIVGLHADEVTLIDAVRGATLLHDYPRCCVSAYFDTPKAGEALHNLLSAAKIAGERA